MKDQRLPKANKDLGQHFLTDQNIISKITHNYEELVDAIVEVGPGPAVLTQQLAKHHLPLYLIEKDQRFKDLLLELVPSENLFLQNALEFSWNKFLEEKDLKGKKIWLVSNLPYNISVPLFRSFMPVSEITFMTLMYQKEVGEKFISGPHKKNQMNSLMFLSQNYFRVEQLAKVKPGAFSPPPKVDSLVVNYERHSHPIIPLHELNKLEKFCRHIFQFKRKQLQKILKTFDTSEEKNFDLFFSENSILPNIRAEALTHQQIYMLFDFVEN